MYFLARQYFKRAKAIYAKHPDPLSEADVSYQLGRLIVSAGNQTEARQHFEQALKIMEEKLGPENPRLVAPLSGLVQVYVASQKRDPAKKMYQRIKALCQQQRCPPEPLYAAQFAWAKALWSDAQDRLKAKELAKLAQLGYASLPKRFEKEHQEIQIWLATHKSL